MSGGLARHLAGICVCCVVAVGCSGAEMSNPDDQLVAVSGQDRGGAAGRAGSVATAPGGSVPGLQSGPTAGRAVTTTAPMSAVTAGAAGIGTAQPTAGAAGAPNTAGSAGTAGARAASSLAGAGGAGGAGGGAGKAGSGGAAGASATGPCPLPLMAHQNHVDDGVPVSGAGCMQQWEGIVMTKGGRGLCTAAFISDRHLISASHCYARDGAVSLDVSAPTWENGASHTFQAQVKRSGSDMALDVSIIDLGKAVEWATPERRFVLHAGKVPSSVDLHLYGFGDGGSSGSAGKLRGVPERATISVTDNGRGTLSGKAGDARLCSGDSGGPAFVEKTAAVLYGINQAIVPTGRGGGGVGSCAGPSWDIMFTNVSEYMDFIEESLGKPCERTRVDDLDVARCW